ncbi:MAG: rRNA pseudouridine synthase [Krumholzibacteria bacterium]|nr:rRNA pseudouridine synthase [Candidatus Krumholzibacteria bacterium]
MVSKHKAAKQPAEPAAPPHKPKRGKEPAPPPWHPPRKMGLARALQQAGWGTRRQTELLVQSGRVDLDGEACTDPRAAVDTTSTIALDGTPLAAVRFRYYAFHKPARVVCVPSDGPNRRLVADFLPGDVPGLRAAGRLDGKTTGLLLVSNDPAWNTVVAGSARLEQEYRVQLDGLMTDLEIGVLSAGVHVPNLGVFRPLSVRIIERLAGRTVLALVVREGKIRQARRMFSTLRHKIVLLRRVRIGEIRLGELAAGALRPLTDEEVESVREAARPGGSPAEA